MNFTKLNVVCDQCNHLNVETVRVFQVSEYAGPILKTFWCEKCKAPQVIRYRFEEQGPTVIEHLEAKDVFIPREPETALTIRPRGTGGLKQRNAK